MTENTAPGRLTLVGTPIGNLGDLSPRALDALRECDFIAAEDTRVTLKLLNHFGVSKPMVSYFEHNKRERGEEICARLCAGENGVLVTDGRRARADGHGDGAGRGRAADGALHVRGLFERGQAQPPGASGQPAG